MLVHKHQVGFVEGRQASNSTHCFIDLIQWVECSRGPSLLLSLTAEEAFNRVHWTYLKEVLIKFGFSGPILPAILDLYSLPSARVLSALFDITNAPFPPLYLP